MKIVLPLMRKDPNSLIGSTLSVFPLMNICNLVISNKILIIKYLIFV